MQNIDNDLRDNNEGNMVSDDAFLSKVTEKLRNDKVPANKKNPIYCNNVVTDYVEFNQEDYVKVYDK